MKKPLFFFRLLFLAVSIILLSACQSSSSYRKTADINAIYGGSFHLGMGKKEITSRLLQQYAQWKGVRYR